MATPSLDQEEPKIVFGEVQKEDVLHAFVSQ